LTKTDLPVAVENLRDLDGITEWLDGDGDLRGGTSREDEDHDNRLRAGWAAEALLVFARRTDLLGTWHAETPEAAIGDLLGNLRHLASLLGLDFDELNAEGQSHYEYEIS
jgi:hypothetical protein